MPCSDTYEILNFKIDEKERLFDFSHKKGSCLKPIGDSKSILCFLEKKSIEEILLISSFSCFLDRDNELDKYQKEKNLSALKDGLRAFKGLNTQKKCLIKNITGYNGSFEVEIEIENQIPSDKIRPCCLSCRGRKFFTDVT